MKESANERISEGVKGRMSKWGRGLLLVVLVLGLLAAAGPAAAQEEELRISVRKQFGYNLGSQIQGTFMIRVRGPENLETVTFLLDDEPLGEATAEPFELVFRTGNHGLGWHRISAVGTTADGQVLTSRTLNFQFVSGEDAGRGVMAIIIPVFVLTVVFTLVAGLFPMLRGRKTTPTSYDPASYSPDEPRNYGVFGGVVCPKCGRPFGMHLWGMNLVVGKYDCCPHCGKWSLVRRASREELLAAEAAEHAAHLPSTPKPASAPAEKLREQLDDSRFTDRI
jgi:hypothetical protein